LFKKITLQPGTPKEPSEYAHAFTHVSEQCSLVGEMLAGS